MLFIYKNKIYVRPFANKIVEVSITKKENKYDVKPTDKTVEIDSNVNKDLYSISLEEAYKMQSKSLGSKFEEK